MAKYYPVYKCMVCGEVQRHPKYLDIELSDAEDQVAAVIRRHQMFGNSPHLPQIPFYITHVCKNGSIGVSQFAGLRRERDG